MHRKSRSGSHLVAGLLFAMLGSACGSGAGPVVSGGTGGTSGGSGGSVGSGGATGTGGSSAGSGGSAVGSGGTGGAAVGGSGSGGAGTGGRGTAGAGTGGATATGGASGGVTGAGGAGTGGRGTAGAGIGGATATGGAGGQAQRFSFFVTSTAAMIRLSNNPQGFGGDLRHGETTGLAGADRICMEIAETSLPGAGSKTWHAFLSVVGPPLVNAIDRVGAGPWYDRLGRLVSMNKASLAMNRPGGADPAIINDLPNEDGVPNETTGAPGCTGDACPDNHDTLTGSNTLGNLDTTAGATCADWTSSAGVANMRPRVGHSWPGVSSGTNWISALYEGGCAPGINLVHGGGPMAGVFTVGTGGGYGGIYCFALTP